MHTHSALRRALPRRQFEALRSLLLESPLVGRSTLGGTFTASRGFAIIFTAEGRETLDRRFPALIPHLDQMLGRPAVRALTRWWQRPGPTPNAWYLNVLLVAAGGSVERHVDATLRKPAGAPEAVPELVSVLYLQVPGGSAGGQLKLWAAGEVIATHAPVENELLHFRGDLAHEVCPFEGAADGLRASLVIEQYHLEPEALARLPAFKLDSRAGFDAFLTAHQAWGLQGQLEGAAPSPAGETGHERQPGDG